MEKEFFDLLGLGVPFYLAAATYAVFSWLDNNASDEATKVISSWLHGRSRNKPDLGNLIISAFDRVYTSPLLTFRAFGRSAAISLISWLLVIFVPRSFSLFGWWNATWEFYKLFFPQFVANILAIVVTDYLSLLFVRRFLNFARTNPIAASVSSSAVGLTVVGLGIVIFSFISNVAYSIDVYGTVNIVDVIIAQRLLLGDAHPLKAIGVLATIIVFGSAMLVKEAWALLGYVEGG
jgi:hypothetical protein